MSFCCRTAQFIRRLDKRLGMHLGMCFFLLLSLPLLTLGLDRSRKAYLCTWCGVTKSCMNESMLAGSCSQGGGYKFFCCSPPYLTTDFPRKRRFYSKTAQTCVWCFWRSEKLDNIAMVLRLGWRKDCKWAQHENEKDWRSHAVLLLLRKGWDVMFSMHWVFDT